MFDGLAYFFKKRKEEKRNKLIDKFIYPIAIIGAFTAIPQVIKIWLYQNASGVSAISWGAFSFLAVIWFIYGIVHKERLVIITSSITFVINILVVLGTLIYG